MKNPKHILFLGTCLLWYSNISYTQSISSLCPNTALVPVFMQDFGQGASPSSTSKAPAGTTNYGFGGVGTDGNYILTPLVNNANKSDWTKGGDHTGILNGNMFLVNAGGGNSIFFKQTVTGLCPGSSFNFSAWLANVNTNSTLSICGAGLVYPKVIFNIKDISGTILGTVTTGNLPLSPVNGPANWNQYGFQFSLPVGVTSLILEMVDFYGGAAACGNDLALDDIVFSACTPQTSIVLSTPSAICAGTNTKILSTTINSPYVSPAYQFQKSTDNGITWNNIGTPTIDSTNFTLNNVQVSDSGKYRVIVGPDAASLGSSTCITASNVIALSVYANPTLTLSTNTPVCVGESLSLIPNIASSASPFTFSWTGPNGFSSIQSNPVINNVSLSATGNYQLKVADVNGCSVSGTLSATVNPTPTMIISNLDLNLCSGSTTSISFNTNVTGSLYKWQSFPISGSINGNSNQALNASKNSINDTLVNNSNNPVTIRYVITVTTPSGCITKDSTTVTVYPKPDIANAGPDQSLCNATSTILFANNPVNGTGIWSLISGPSSVIFSNNSVFNSTVSGLVAGKYLLSWAISNGNCFVSCDTVSINIFSDPPIPNAGPDQTLCYTTNILLNADTTASQYGRWSELSGPTAVVFSNAFSPSTDVTGLSMGNYQFIWTLSNGACADTKDTVNIKILPTIINANAGVDQNLCNSNTIILSGNIPTSGIGYWMLVSGPSAVNILNTDSVTTSVSGLILGSYLFSWNIQNFTCAVISDTVQISITQPVTIANAGIDQTLCNNSSALLNGNLPSVGSGSWSLLTGPSAVTFSNITSPTTDVSGLISGDYQFVWSITNGSCSPSNDTVIVHILPTISNSNAGADQNLCNINTINLAGNIPSSGNGSWALVTGPTAVSIQNKDSASTSVNGLIPGTYLFSWTIQNASCAAVADTVQINISEPGSIANAGPDQTLCNATSTSLNANLPSVGLGSWTLLAGPSSVTFSNTSSPTSDVNGLIPGNYQFVWSIANGTCTASKDTVIVIVNPAITNANAGADQNLCNTNTIDLIGNVPSSGNGSWTLVTGPSVVSIQNKDSASTSVSGIIPGTYLFSWTIQNASCAAVPDTVQINILEPSFIANAGPDQTLCNIPTTSLNANLPIVGSGSWTLLTGPSAVTFSNTSSPTSDVNGLVPGSYQFVWSISNGVCSPSKDTVIVIVNPALTNANAGGDQTLCYTDSVILSGNSPNIGSGKWTLISGQTQAYFANDTISNTTVKGISSENYQFVWTISGNGCSNSADTVNVQILPLISNIIDTNSIKTCQGTTLIIKGKIGAGGNNNILYQWEKSLDGIHWKNIIGAIDSVYTFLADSSYQFRRKIVSGNCNSESDIVSVIVYPTLSSNTISSNQEICSGQTMQPITGSIPIGGNGIFSYQWEWSSDSVQWKIVDSANGINLNPININDHAFFKRLVSNSICNANIIYSNIVSVKVRPLPVASLIFPTKIGCAPFSIDSLFVKNIVHSENTGTYQWLANGQFLSVNEHFPGIVLQKDSVIIKLIALSKYGCRPDTATATFIVPQKLNIAFALSDTGGCGPLTVSFTNQTGNPSQNSYQWNLGNGLSSTLEQPLQQTYNASLSGKDTTYVIKLSVQNSCDADSIERKITVKRKGITDLSVTTLNSCSPMNVSFQNLSIGDNTSYRLVFGDGSDTIINANSSLVHTYHTGINTNFLALLRAQNQCGIDSLIIPIKALPNPVHVSLKLNDTAVCGAPFTLQVQNQTTTAKNMQWEWGDGSPAVTTSLPIPISHTYQNPGSYLIISTVNSGCSDSAIFKPLVIYPSVKAAVAAIIPMACIGESVAFQNTSDTLLSFFWNLGDGTISSDRSLQHDYKTFGSFQTTLKTWSTHPQITCSDSIIIPIQIIKERKGKFLLSDSLGKCLPFTLKVYNTNGPSTKTIWNWGDGTSGTGDSASHIYKIAGKFLVTMYAESIGGCLFKDSAYVTVVSPTVQLSYKGGVYCTSGNPIEFLAITDRTDSVRWEFGDGTTAVSSLNKTIHSYQRSGTFLPKLQLISQNGTCIIPISASDTIIIDEVKADMQLSAIYDCGKTAFRFIETSQSYFPVIDRNWTMNKVPISVNKEFQKTFTQQGQNETAIQVKTINGCSSTIQASYKVNIYQFPQANINAINEACLNHIMELKSEVTSIDSVNSRYWNLGNGTIATDSVVKVFYNNDGKYTIKLTVSTVNSCYDSAFKEITIHPKPTISMLPDQILCSGDSLTLYATGASSYIWKDQNNNVICTNCTTTTVKPNKSTSFQVIGFSEFGCSNIASTVIRVVQPFKLLVTTPDTICVGDSKRLLVTGGSTYNWRADPGLSNTNSATPVVSPKTTTTFHVTAKDSYKCFTDSADIKIVVGKPTPFTIGMDTAVLSGTPVQLHAFSNSNDIKKWQWRGNATFSCLSCEAPTAKVIFDECLNCTATNIYGCVSTDTVCIKTFCPTSEVFIPNAFSPDGDGINDLLIVQGRGLKMVKSFRIYNRWGELVFERTNFYPGDASSGWNGKVRGSMPSPDVFVYVCEVICERGVPATFKGNVAIIK